jgi:hypothetical protein
MYWIARWCGGAVVVQPEKDETCEAAMLDWRDWADAAGLGDGAADEKLAVFILSDPGPTAPGAARTLVMAGLSLADRRRAHDICQSVGLEHRSEGSPGNRTLVVTKPRGWIWTAVTPQILSPRPERQRDAAAKRNETLRATYCDECKQHGIAAELLCSETCDAILCSGCLQMDGTIQRDSHIWQRMRDYL